MKKEDELRKEGYEKIVVNIREQDMEEISSLFI